MSACNCRCGLCVHAVGGWIIELLWMNGCMDVQMHECKDVTYVHFESC